MFSKYLGVSHLHKARSLSNLPQKNVSTVKSNNSNYNKESKSNQKAGNNSEFPQIVPKKTSPESPRRMNHQRSLNTLNTLLAPKEKLEILHDGTIINDSTPLTKVLSFGDEEEAYAFIEGLLAKLKEKVGRLQEQMQLRIIERYDLNERAEEFAKDREKILHWFDELRKSIPIEIRYQKKWLDSLISYTQGTSNAASDQIIALMGVKVFLETESKKLPISCCLEEVNCFKQAGGSEFSYALGSAFGEAGASVSSFWQKQNAKSPSPNSPNSPIHTSPHHHNLFLKNKSSEQLKLKIEKFCIVPKFKMPTPPKEEEQEEEFSKTTRKNGKNKDEEEESVKTSRKIGKNKEKETKKYEFIEYEEFFHKGHQKGPS